MIDDYNDFKKEMLGVKKYSPPFMVTNCPKLGCEVIKLSVPAMRLKDVALKIRGDCIELRTINIDAHKE